MINGLNKIRPGEVIASDVMNIILEQLADHEQRLSKLETGISSPGSGTAAIGSIDIQYAGSSPRGINLVPGDTIPYPHTFTAINNTNQTLTLQLSGSVTAPHGNWANSVQIRTTDGVSLPSVTLESGKNRDFIAAVTAPSDATVGDHVSLVVSAKVGAPHNKQTEEQLVLIIASQGGPIVVRSVTITKTQLPPGGTDPITAGAILTYAFDLRYSATQPPATASFTFKATLTNISGTGLSEWGVDFVGRMLTTLQQACIPHLLA